MTIFIDTSAFIAYFNQDDQHHADAVQSLLTIVQQERPLLTTNYVLLETTALLQRRFGIAAVKDFQEALLPLLQIIWVDQQLHEMGITAVLTANRRGLSLVDCISFIVCRQHTIRHVFAYDHHFIEQGFENL